MKRFACYIILAQDTKTKEIFGRTEQSISMGMNENYVRVERDFEFKYGAKNQGITNRTNAYRQLKKTVDELNNKFKNRGRIYKIFRVGSKHCPVRIDWRNLEHKRKNGRVNNSVWRNLPFSVKENVTF